jgi:hypothetical protein
MMEPVQHHNSAALHLIICMFIIHLLEHVSDLRSIAARPVLYYLWYVPAQVWITCHPSLFLQAQQVTPVYQVINHADDGVATTQVTYTTWLWYPITHHTHNHNIHILISVQWLQSCNCKTNHTWLLHYNEIANTIPEIKSDNQQLHTCM